MKDSISIIFTALIGTFLIVLLPLYSILDRQDSMSYNVVLTETTNFVDEIRNNGFIDRDSYYDYIAALASTANTYKVTIEAYRKTLIPETDEFGNAIDGSFVEELELYNTMDILEVLDGEGNIYSEKASIKNNVYLFNQNDEIYIKVKNTNITTGSLLYNMFAGTTNTEVINISYGGIVNKINWELYHKVHENAETLPEVKLSIPVNRENNANIFKVKKIDEKDGEELEYINCAIVDLETCIDSIANEHYTYLYDLKENNNKTIKLAIELINIDKVSVNNEYKEINSLTEEDLKYIANTYIQLNGMYADKKLSLRPTGDYYTFDLVLTDVRMSSLDYIASLASITILPGLGIDNNNIMSLGTESVQLELKDISTVNSVMISGPHIWQKFLNTKSLQTSLAGDEVYVNEDIMFTISYTGINASDEEIVEAIRNNFIVHLHETSRTELEIYTATKLNEDYEINLETVSAGHIIVKFKYLESNKSESNYVELLDGWIKTNIDEIINEQEGEEIQTYANGVISNQYSVLVDDIAPRPPEITLDGTLGNNGWFRSEVEVKLVPSTTDLIKKHIIDRDVTRYIETIGGSGVEKNTLIFSGAKEKEETATLEDIIADNGTTYITAKAYDYVGNDSEVTREVKIDTESPTLPTIITKCGEQVLNEESWCTDAVEVSITPGTDYISGVEETTYTIKHGTSETTGYNLNFNWNEDGQTIITATTKDVAGNETSTSQAIYIDSSEPPKASIEIISGDKRDPDIDWYYTDVTLKINVDELNSASGRGKTTCNVYHSTGITTYDFTTDSKEIPLTKDGTHIIDVITHTGAGKEETVINGYEIKIDTNLPNKPELKVISGELGENGWYITDAKIQVIRRGDNGPSGEIPSIIYTKQRIVDGVIDESVQVIEQETLSNTISLAEEGEWLVTVYTKDMAYNKAKEQITIKIDETLPTSAEFILKNRNGEILDNDAEWYTEDIYISYTGQSDATSGIQNVQLSRDSITSDTIGTKVTLITKDNAGHSVTKEKIIKVDKSKPTGLIIDLPQPTGAGIHGVNLYNKMINVSIIKGEDYIGSTNTTNRTTFKVLKDGIVIQEEKEGTKYQFIEDGKYQFIARTYDKAGNYIEVTKNIWIDTTSLSTPKIVSLNGISDTNKITSTHGKIELEVDDIDYTNSIYVILTNRDSGQVWREKARLTENNGKKIISVILQMKGLYTVKVVQANMYGTESNESEGTYLYKYE